MGDIIESFRKIQKDNIHLAFSSAQLSGYTIESCDELCLVALTFPESMLIVTEDAIVLKVAHGATVHDMFQYLACFACQRDWSIVTSLMFITFLKMGTMLAFLQSSGNVPEFSDFWNILVSAGASSSAAVLRINTYRNGIGVGCFISVQVLC